MLKMNTLHALSDVLKQETCLIQTLWLDTNKIGSQGVEYLSKAIKHKHCKLEDLNLGNNKIGTDGIKELCRGFRK